MSVQSDAWEVPASQLRWRCDSCVFSFSSTAEVPPLSEIVGQARALKALKMGLEIRSKGFNIFVTGMAGTGRTSTVVSLMESLGVHRDPPPDICYVHNFREPGYPRALVLPAGAGSRLARDMESLVSYAHRLIPRVLEEEPHVRRRKTVIDRFQGKDRQLTEAFAQEVEKANFRMVTVQEGPFAHVEVVPLLEGQPVSLEELNRQAPPGSGGDGRKVGQLRQRHDELMERLQEMVGRRRELQRELEEELRELDRKAALSVLATRIQELRQRYASEKVAAYLEEVQESLLLDVEKMRAAGEEAKAAESEGGTAGSEERRDPFRNYRVHVVVDNSRTKGAPVIQEPNPAMNSLFGAVEWPPGPGEETRREFVAIRAGSLLKANGGYLVIDAHDLMADPAVWPALKRALKNQLSEIQSAELGYLLSPSVIKPEPVEVDLTVVLIGELALYYYLYAQDEDFRKIFKVRADFDSEMPLNGENIRRYAAFVSKICQEEHLTPFDSSGVAAIVEHGARLTGRRNKLSVQFSDVADLAREASYWARQAGQAVVERCHVERAILERTERSSLLEEKTREMVDDGLILIDTEGDVVGQVNGLTVLEMGEYVFGRPVRITAITAVGRSGVINIERESFLSGKIHDKGVLILAGYLRGKYSQDKPLTVSASICFEQSYGGVDGDSASAAEVFAILSSLAELPLKQGIGVTGSVNQLGEVQAVGGVNEKVESFYDLCRHRGLTGHQGVIIPGANVAGLMLRPDLVEAVAAGRFHVYAVRTVDEGMEILTGVPAGQRLPPPDSPEQEAPIYPPGTVNGRVDERLRVLAMDLKYFGEEGEEPPEAGPRRPEEEEEGEV